MNNKHLIRAAFLCFLICIVCLVLFMQVNCKPKSRGTFEPYVPDDPQTCVSMDSARVSYDD